ncbi:MAG TPA: thiopurine S-methyltransferase [Bdellovibrionota bacterium]|jgi:thiopurine S-methyltransferase|nr:thiopurine S-methyltransferase [Bdellovibrionota bacterium]
MKQEFWHQRWQSGEIRFHQSLPNPLMVKYFPKVEGKIMVPLCGKSLDLLWLRDQGHEVVGVELVAAACDAFFEENHLPVKIEKQGAFTVYRGDRITLWCGDFFATPAEAWKDVTLVYDRASFIALPPDMRTRYGAYLVSQNSVRQMLLLTVEYPVGNIQGPPFSIPDAEVHTHFDSVYDVSLLESIRDTQLSGKAPKFEETEVQERVYLLERR